MSKFGEIRCPHCGYDGEDKGTSSSDPSHVSGGFRYLEDVVVYRTVVRVEGETIHIDGFYQSGEGYDDGQNGRLECRACYGEFPIPPKLKEEFE